jgi:aminoglycoside phosphotransferase family enzyme/predicted kinase
MNTDAALLRHAELIAALMRPAAYPHAAARVELIETHISSVLLAGEFAYKIKKPVNLGFVDFSSLAQRRFYCEEEVRLNRRTAPQLYLDVVPIAGTELQPRLGGEGTPIEYAVRMRRFAGDALLDVCARRGDLNAVQIDRLARAIADFHALAARADPESSEGTPNLVLRWARENFVQLQAQPLRADVAAALVQLSAWTEREVSRLRASIEHRREHGFVRECHGDLHLGNIVLLDGDPTLFDAIEFNRELRWIDVINDLAFTYMDLFDHGLPQFGWRLLDRYLQATGDYAGLDLLRFYSVYRALVRAKVARIRAAQPALADRERQAALAHCAHYVRLAATLARRGMQQPVLAIMSGLSGSGKTTVAGRLLEGLGAVRVRSDVERKRLAGIDLTARLEGPALNALYSADATRQTYARVADLSRVIIGAGYPAIIDAAFLRRAERDEFRTLARAAGARFALIECTAAVDVLRARVTRRIAKEADASDATAAVLEGQLAMREPVADEEQAYCYRIATDVDDATLEARCAEVAAQLPEAD